MQKGLAQDEIYLIKNRDIHSGKLSVFWKILKREKFNGRFLIRGEQFRAILDIIDGVLPNKGFVYLQKNKRITGNKGMNLLMQNLRKATGVRFSLIVRT